MLATVKPRTFAALALVKLTSSASVTVSNPRRFAPICPLIVISPAVPALIVNVSNDEASSAVTAPRVILAPVALPFVVLIDVFEISFVEPLTLITPACVFKLVARLIFVDDNVIVCPETVTALMLAARSISVSATIKTLPLVVSAAEFVKLPGESISIPPEPIVSAALTFTLPLVESISSLPVPWGVPPPAPNVSAAANVTLPFVTSMSRFVLSARVLAEPEKETPAPVRVLLRISSGNESVFPVVSPSTVIAFALAPPIVTDVPAVIRPSSASETLKPPATPAPIPTPCTALVARLTVPDPTSSVPVRSKSAAVMLAALLPNVTDVPALF